MTRILDRSGNGVGVELEPSTVNLLPAGADVTVPGKVTAVRTKGAGNIIFRPPGGTADLTLAMVDGEYLDMQPGTVIRNTGTTVTAITGVNRRSSL